MAAQAPSVAATLDTALLDRLRHELLADREAQVTLLAQHEPPADQRSSEGVDATLLEQEFAQAVAARARLLLDEIDAALGRMDDGTYGRCQTCGAPIPVERLEAVPHARTCVHCPVPATRRLLV